MHKNDLCSFYCIDSPVAFSLMFESILILAEELSFSIYILNRQLPFNLPETLFELALVFSLWYYLFTFNFHFRNVLVESARIARGQISNLNTLKAVDYDLLVVPGGFGAAKNL